MFDGSVSLVQVMGVSVFTMIFNLAGANLRHSHVWVGFGPLERWLISPAQHQIHHSIKAEHLNANFGATIAVWDRWLGTWISSKGQTVEHIGLAGPPRKQHFFRHLTGI